MDGAQPGLKAKDAIDAGFKVFREFFSGTKLTHVLLEGLEYDYEEDQWTVTIGFDTGRIRETREGLASVAPGLAGTKISEPLRDSREFLIKGADGSFVRMRTH